MLPPLDWYRVRSAWDRVPRLHFRAGHHLLPAWITMGVLGAGAGASLFIGLARAAGLPIWLAPAISVANVAGFLAWTMVSSRWRGGRRYVLLEHALVAAGSSTAGAALAGIAPARVLDVWLIAIALALASGRIGCLLVGCCHGKPSLRGVRYHWRLPWLLGPQWHLVRLFPLQAVEAMGLAVLAALGAVLLLSMISTAGTVAAVISAGYAVMRFELELWRGDERRYIGPLSHNQWACVAVAMLVLLLDAWIATATMASLGALALAQRRQLEPPSFVVTSETHMAALASAIAVARAGERRTAAGFALEPDGCGGVCVSGVRRPLTPADAQLASIAAARRDQPFTG